jgi:hypothetical protein
MVELSKEYPSLHLLQETLLLHYSQKATQLSHKFVPLLANVPKLQLMHMLPTAMEVLSQTHSPFLYILLGPQSTGGGGGTDSGAQTPFLKLVPVGQVEHDPEIL